MKTEDILNMIIAKVEAIKVEIENDYTKGKISLLEKNSSLYYIDEIRYSTQKTLKSLSKN